MPAVSRERLNLRRVFNRHHWHNQGKVAHWLVLPGLDGGRQWFDPWGSYHGTLTSMITSSSGWRGTTRPGGWGHLLGNGTDSYVIVGLNLLRVPGSVCMWVRLNSRGSSDGQPVLVHSNNAYWGVHGTSGFLEFFNASWRVASSGAIGVGEWHRVGISVASAGTAMYLDGAQVYSSSLAMTATATTSSIGARTDQLSSPRTVDGAYDDVCFYSSAQPANFFAADNDLSRGGYPGVLNRVSMSMAPMPPAGRLFRYAGMDGGMSISGAGV
jgi:hypothetical protein